MALRAVACGTLLGAGFTAVSLWGARSMQVPAPPGASPSPPTAGLFLLVVGGTLAGVILAVALAWRLMPGLGSAYRRGGLSMIAGFGAVLAMLPAMAADGLFGRTGLVGYAALCAGLAWLLARSAARRSSPA